MGPIKSSQRHSAQYWFCFLFNIESCNTSYKDPYDQNNCVRYEWHYSYLIFFLKKDTIH